jgi:maltose alpha-D-glucosyltransferase / alpha-amylase
MFARTVRFVDPALGYSCQVITDLWMKNAVVYSLDVETFLDANGDGCGDFEGLTRRLDYLEALGIDALWLAPFQPSPNRDDGYDITDYYGVQPRFGTLGDFVEFVREANARGLRVIVDLVVNHTSDAHPWFVDARRGSDSNYHDWYVWSKKRPADWKSGMVFPGHQDSTWSYARPAQAYYFHRFYDFQPDLNMENPRVRAEVLRIIGFWLALDVAGFRLDAVPFILEKPSAGGRKPALRFEYLREMREFLQWRAGDAVLLGEANVPPGDATPYFAGGHGLHMMFNFWVNQHLFAALATEDARPLADALRATRRIPATAQWAHFLRNHDELDLGHLDDEQQPRVFEAYGPEPAMQLYGRGIRRRLAPMLGDRRKLELANSLLLSLPGTPVLRYGEEIGMGDDLSLPERNAIRTPMQWSDAEHAGFSTAQQTVRPVISDGVYGYENVNVERQRRDPESLLRWTTRMIRLRKECPEIGWGSWNAVASGSTSVLALSYEWRGDAVVCVHNLAGEPRTVSLTPKLEGETLTNLLVDEDVERDERGRFRFPIDAYGYRWFRLGARRESLRRGATVA